MPENPISVAKEGRRRHLPKTQIEKEVFLSLPSLSEKNSTVSYRFTSSSKPRTPYRGVNVINLDTEGLFAFRLGLERG